MGFSATNWLVQVRLEKVLILGAESGNATKRSSKAHGLEKGEFQEAKTEENRFQMKVSLPL